MQDETARTLGWALSAGAFFGAVAFALVLVLDLANGSFVADLEFVVSSTLAAVLAGSVLWWRAVERHGECTRRRGAAVGGVVGFVGPTLAFALNPSLYDWNSGIVIEVVGTVVGAGLLGFQGHLSTYGLLLVLGAITGWSFAGYAGAVRD